MGVLLPLAFALVLVQEPATIEGRVTLAGTDAPVPEAIVRVAELGRWTVTDADGRFTLRDLPDGRWRLEVERAGFMATTATVLVPRTGSVRVDLRLQESRVPYLVGRVLDPSTGRPIIGAAITVTPGPRTETDGQGLFRVELPREDRYAVRAWAYGYEPVDTVATPAVAPDTLVLHLSARPVDIRPLTIRTRATAGRQGERALFEREPRPGVIGFSHDQMEDVPVMIEPDVVRSLQALPGVVQINDLSARLHVRGGGPDQNLFLLDGARVFAPYHLFGIYGAFNTDAVSRVDFYRGDLAARHGGALSAVVDITQRDDAAQWVEGDVALGVLAAAATVRGIIPGLQGRWMVSGRRSTIADILESELWWERRDSIPFDFSDVQARVSLQPTPSHRASVSWFASTDRFSMAFLDPQGAGAVRSGWSNRVGSFRWDWDLGPQWSTLVSAWTSAYHHSLEVGVGNRPPASTNDVAVSGYRVEAARRGATGIRVGVEVQDGRVGLGGGERPGGYVEGAVNSSYGTSAAYLELERRLGPVRLAPGVRLEELNGGERHVAPRLAARLNLTDDIAFTVGLGRTHQDLSTLRDDRYVLPGPPFWFVHPEGGRVSTADGVSAALEGWLGERWSFAVNGYGRRFRDLPVWRPVGSRALSELEWHGGEARGVELILRRHAGELGGWLSYGYGGVVFRPEGGTDYAPTWDRRHAIDGALFAQLGRFRVGARAVYGTGTPFWPPVGIASARWLAPSGRVETRDGFPVWSEEQMRYPTYFRADAFTRAEFRVGRVTLTPYAGMLNMTGRPNVLYYEAATIEPESGLEENAPRLELRPHTIARLAFVPTVGLDIRF